MIQIAPSILSADFSKLLAEIKETEAGGADLIHVDVMDGHFVPNITIGAVVVRSLYGKTRAPLDVHLMISDPDRYIPDFVVRDTNSGKILHAPKYFTVHIETCNHLHRTIQVIRQNGAKPGIVLNPHTPLSSMQQILPEIELVLLMSVNPGFGGQEYIEFMTDKLKAARRMIDDSGYDILLQVDGGVDIENICKIAATGVDIIVAGSAIFGTNKDGKKDPRENTKKLKELANSITI